jgi:hypothetical protein
MMKGVKTNLPTKICVYATNLSLVKKWEKRFGMR